MLSSQILSITTFIYGVSGILYVFAWIFGSGAMSAGASRVLFAAVLANGGGLVMRWRESYILGFGHAPLSNLYESLIFFALAIGIAQLIVERRFKMPLIGAFAGPLAFLVLAYASLSPDMNDRIQPLIPALKSNWLIAHVMTCFIGYASFTIGFCASIMYLISKNREGKGFLPSRFSSADALEALTQQVVTVGFLFLTMGIITGAVWANSAWGRYWGWDPKETWSLITWLFYAAFLHARLMRGWTGNGIATLSIIGFISVMFTYFGVNYLPGLHSYGSPG